MEKIIGIYKITSPSGKIYIGQSKNIYYRFQKYKYLICKSQIKLYRSLKKYGVNNHSYEIVEKCDIKELNEKELYYQILYNSVSCGLNCVYAQKTDYSISNETREKMKISQKKRFENPLEREKMSLAAKKRNASYSEDKKKKLRTINKGKKRSKEVVEKLKIINKKGAHPQAKKIINTNTNLIYKCIIDGWEKEIKGIYSYKYFCQMLTNKRKNKTNFKFYEL